MRILALETSSVAGSVAVLDDEQVLAELFLPAGQRSAQALAPAIAGALEMAQWRPQDIQLVAVTQGPGSFTGLRVGVATAKTLAYAVGSQVLGVNTLEAIAAQAPETCPEVWTLLDAYRGQLFTARYQLRADDLPQPLAAPHVELSEHWLARYQPHEYVSGPGLSRVASRLPPGAAVVDRALGAPRAATVGKLALLHYRRGRRDDVWTFAPNYYRPSAAEEKHAP